ncbi:MAG: excisionase family DNA-binding protein [Desulfomonile tiedjei]|nr:excisionase family DNA-binding protein [Desulfomonile tiedjei]
MSKQQPCRHFPSLSELLNGGDLIRPDELAKAQKVSIGTVYAWMERGTIPFLELGRSKRLDPQEVAQWLELKRRAARKVPGGGPAVLTT